MDFDPKPLLLGLVFVYNAFLLCFRRFFEAAPKRAQNKPRYFEAPNFVNFKKVIQKAIH